MPDDRYRHQENPDISDQVRDVGKVCECDELEAVSLHGNVPKCLYRSAYERQCHRYADSPRDDECGGREYDFAEQGDHEDAVVKGEDPELDENKGEVIEVAEDVVALQSGSARVSRQKLRLPHFSDHHQVVRFNSNDVSSHAMWWAVSQTRRTLTNQTYLFEC